jgi:Ca-activated chloride channel family protein
MRFATYTKYKGGWLDAMNLESLMESLSGFFMNGGFAGGPNYHPFWGWSGLEDTSSVDALKNALLKALVEGGQLTQEMVEELRGEGQGDEAVQKQIADLLDELIQRMVEEGYLTLEDGAPTMPGAVQAEVENALSNATDSSANLSR